MRVLILHGHAEFSHDHAKWTKDIMDACLHNRFSHGHQKFSHDCVKGTREVEGYCRT